MQVTWTLYCGCQDQPFEIATNDYKTYLKRSK